MSRFACHLTEQLDRSKSTVVKQIGKFLWNMEKGFISVTYMKQVAVFRSGYLAPKIKYIISGQLRRKGAGNRNEKTVKSLPTSNKGKKPTR